MREQQVYYTVIPEMFGNVNRYLLINGDRQSFGTFGSMAVASERVKAQYPQATFVSFNVFEGLCRKERESKL